MKRIFRISLLLLAVSLLPMVQYLAAAPIGRMKPTKVRQLKSANIKAPLPSKVTAVITDSHARRKLQANPGIVQKLLPLFDKSGFCSKVKSLQGFQQRQLARKSTKNKKFRSALLSDYSRAMLKAGLVSTSSSLTGKLLARKRGRGKKLGLAKDTPTATLRPKIPGTIKKRPPLGKKVLLPTMKKPRSKGKPSLRSKPKLPTLRSPKSSKRRKPSLRGPVLTKTKTATSARKKSIKIRANTKNDVIPVVKPKPKPKSKLGTKTSPRVIKPTVVKKTTRKPAPKKPAPKKPAPRKPAPRTLPKSPSLSIKR